YFRPFFDVEWLRGKIVLDAGTGAGQLVHDLRAQGITAFGADIIKGKPIQGDIRHMILADLTDPRDIARVRRRIANATGTDGRVEVLFHNFGVAQYWMETPEVAENDKNIFALLRGFKDLLKLEGSIRMIPADATLRKPREHIRRAGLKVQQFPGDEWK